MTGNSIVKASGAWEWRAEVKGEVCKLGGFHVFDKCQGQVLSVLSPTFFFSSLSFNRVSLSTSLTTVGSPSWSSSRTPSSGRTSSRRASLSCRTSGTGAKGQGQSDPLREAGKSGTTTQAWALPVDSSGHSGPGSEAGGVGTAPGPGPGILSVGKSGPPPPCGWQVHKTRLLDQSKAHHVL